MATGALPSQGQCPLSDTAAAPAPKKPKPAENSSKTDKTLAQQAAEEVESLSHEEPNRRPLHAKPAPLSRPPAPAEATAATDRQKTIAEKRVAAETAQKILDDEKEREQLEEENKN